MKTRRLLLMTMLALLASVTYAASVTIGDLKYTYNEESGTASVSLASFNATSVTIPATVVINGTTYKVTAIDNYGFCKKVEWWQDLYTKDILTYDYNDNTYYIDGSNYNNTVLQSVTFDQPSNITTIGNYAFNSCTKLESIVIPNSVTSMGTAAFKGCISLTDVRFQTKEDGTVNLETIPTQCFRYCPFTSIEIPEGITTIGDEAFQFNLYLKTMKLPNTLTTIGTHFLCDAKSITTLTIPASVTDIDGAAFHGCENLKTVYLLGPASTLKANDDSSKTFGPNKEQDYAPNCEKVTNCTFWVLEEYEKGYIGDDVWKQVDQPNNDGNDIMCIKNTTRTFAQGWGTAIFPKVVKNFRLTAGSGAKVARMIKAVKDNSDMNLYHLTFQVVDGDDIPAKEPLMIYCPYEWTCTMYDSTDENDADFKLEMTKRFTTTKTVENEPTSKVHMIGKYLGGEKLVKWDFYFMNNQFKRVPDDDNAATMGSFRCYWKVDRDGIKQDVASFSKMSFGDNTPTAIEGIETEPTKVQVEVYDLNGRRIYQKKESLPRGLYIINGKKVIIK